jgi:hypothetical protein
MDTPTDPSKEVQISLDKYVSAIWRGKWLIIAITLIAAGIAWFVARSQPTTHTATCSIEAGRVWKEAVENPYATKEIINGDTFLRSVADKHSVRPAQLKRSVQADVVEGGARFSRHPIFIRITAATEDSSRSLLFAQEVADAVIARHEKLFAEMIAPRLENQRRLEERLEELASQQSSRELVLRLESELAELRLNNTEPNSKKSAVIEPPSITATVAPQVIRRVLAATVIAGMLVTILVVLLAYFRRSPPSG